MAQKRLGAMQAIRDDVKKAEQDELVQRKMAYQKWGLRAGLHLTGNNTIPLDESHCHFIEHDRIAVAECAVLELLPFGVQTHKQTHNHANNHTQTRTRTYNTHTNTHRNHPLHTTHTGTYLISTPAVVITS